MNIRKGNIMSIVLFKCEDKFKEEKGEQYNG